MERIERESSLHSVCNALNGKYVSGKLDNGIEYRLQGALMYMQGTFENAPRTISIPVVQSRLIANCVTNEGNSYAVIAEPNSGFLKMPEELWNKGVCIFATCIVNY